MALDKVIVRLSHNCSKPGVLFVALTRVRHPNDLLLDDDFPSYLTIRRQLLHSNFAARQQWECGTIVLFSRTIRRRMSSEEWFSDEVCWDELTSRTVDGRETVGSEPRSRS